MGDRPERVKVPAPPKVDGHKLIADAINGATEAIREAFGPRVEVKAVDTPKLFDAAVTLEPYYETEGQRMKRLLAEVRARVLLLSGYREEDQPNAGDVAQNELAQERTDAVMAFFDLAQGHPLPRKLLPRGDRTGDWLPPGTPVTVLGLHAGVVAPEEDRVLVQMEGVGRPVSFPRSAIAKEGEEWTPPKPTP